VAAGCLAGVRWSRAAIIGVYVVAISGLAVNLLLLRDGGTMLRSAYAVQAKAAFAGLDLAGENARPNFQPPPVPGGQGVVPGNQSPLSFPFDAVEEADGMPSERYFAAARRYGHLGYSLPELRASSDSVRAQADSILVAALGLKLSRGGSDRARGACRTFGAGGASSAPLPRKGALFEEDMGGPVELQRFARTWWVPIGSLKPGRPALLRIPTDQAPDPWRVSVGGELRICALR
jgi:hypothetical protein